MTREEIEGQENEISKASKSNPELFRSYVKQKSKRTESIPNLTKEDGELTASDQEQTELPSNPSAQSLRMKSPEIGRSP